MKLFRPKQIILSSLIIISIYIPFSWADTFYIPLEGVDTSLLEIGRQEKTYKPISVLKLSFDKPVIIQGPEYARISLAGCKVWDSDPGAAKLPVKSLKLLVPYGQRAVGLKIEVAETKALSGSYLLEPAVIPKHIDNSRGLDSSIPEPEDVYPPHMCGNVFIRHKHGYPILFVNLFPVKYSPSSGEVFYYPSVNISLLTISLKGSSLGRDYSIKHNTRPGVVKEIRSFVDNPQVLKTYLEGKNNTGNELAKEPRKGGIR